MYITLDSPPEFLKLTSGRLPRIHCIMHNLLFFLQLFMSCVFSLEL